MTKIAVAAQLAYVVQQPTSFSFSFLAAHTPAQVVSSESIDLGPDTQWSTVPYGEGTHQLVRLTVEPGDLFVNYTADVSVTNIGPAAQNPDEVPFGELPADVLPYLNASRYCESDLLGDFAWRHFGHLVPGYQRVLTVSNWVHNNFVYQPGSTDSSTSATDALLQRAGVCRDYAHVAIALCRAIGVPARYVSGYGVGVEPQDFHGFFEAYIGFDWHLFDPSGMTQPGSLVRIGYGRDAADVPFASFVGQAILTNKRILVTAEAA